jgi:small subunit ribosomal protein S6
MVLSGSFLPHPTALAVASVSQAHREEEGTAVRRYELMLLLRPDMEDDKLQSAVEKVTRAVVNAGGNLTKVSPWGKRRLAYRIQHHREASYFLIHFDIEPAAIRELERGFLISEEILRHMVTVIEERGDVQLPPAVTPASEDGREPAEAAIGEPEVAEAPGWSGADEQEPVPAGEEA